MKLVAVCCPECGVQLGVTWAEDMPHVFCTKFCSDRFAEKQEAK